MVLNFSGPAQALANLLRLDIADLADQVLLGGCAVGRGAAVEAAKVDVARGDVGELVSKDELLMMMMMVVMMMLVSKDELLKCSCSKYETWSSATTLEFRLQQLLETEKLTTPVNPDHWLFVMIIRFQHPENRKI